MTDKRPRFRIPLAIPIIAISILYLAYSLYFQFALRSLFEDYEHKLFFERKYLLDLLCDEAEAYIDNPDFVPVMQDAFSRIDLNPGNYGALFTVDMQLLSSRTPQFTEAPFDPTDYPALVTMMKVLERGETDIWFDKANVPAHTLRVYFRKIGGYIAFIGVSQYAIEPWFSAGVTQMAVVLAVSSFICCAFCIVAVIAERRYRAYGRAYSDS